MTLLTVLTALQNLSFDLLVGIHEYRVDIRQHVLQGYVGRVVALQPAGLFEAIVEGVISMHFRIIIELLIIICLAVSYENALAYPLALAWAQAQGCVQLSALAAQGTA